MPIVENKAEVNAKIGNAIAKKLSKKMKTAARKTSDKLVDFLFVLFSNSETYKSLTYYSGRLRGEFGLDDHTANNVVPVIVKQMLQRINLETSDLVFKGNNKFSGGVRFEVSRTDYSDVDFNLGQYVNTGTGTLIQWLDWLLLQGTEGQIFNFQVSFGNYSPDRSRSTIAIMVPAEGSNWNVPPEFSGTPENNWITKTLNGNADAIIDFICTTFREELCRLL